MAKLPSSVRIAGLPYAIVQGKDETNGPGYNYGFMTASGSKIWINEEMEPPQKASTLIHEIMHAIYKSAGLENHLKPDPEEIIVRAFEPFILSLSVDNPKIIK
jgi:Zn-dependent peptidase ImmA (M78 family)